MAKKEKKDPERESAVQEISKKFRQSPALYIGSVVILVLVLVTFLGGDILSGGRFGGGSGDLTFGYYDGVPISHVPGNAFSRIREHNFNLFQSHGIDVTDFRVIFEIWQQSYNQALTHVAISQILNRSNYSVPETIVNRAVARLPIFQDNGRFSPVLYRQTPEAHRQALWRQEHERITQSVFLNDIYGLLVSETESNFIADMTSLMRVFEIVSFSVDDFPDSEYLSFARANARLFNTIQMSIISVSNEREASRILSSLSDGTITFEDAARIHSQDGFGDGGGDMGSRFFFELDTEIPNAQDRDIITALRRGELSAVTSTVHGWSIFRIENALTAPNFEDENVISRVRSHVRSFHRGRMEDWAVAQAREFISDALESGFENAALLRGLDKDIFGPLPINFGGVDLFNSLDSFAILDFTAQELQHLSTNENFWRVAFSAHLNTPSEPLVHGGRVIVFYPVEQIYADEGYINSIASHFPFWNERSLSRAMHLYFLNNERMEDNFMTAFLNILMQ